MTLMEELERELFPAFDAGDAEAFEAFVRDRFSTDVEWMLWGWENRGLDRLLGEWLDQQRAWNPQKHSVLHRVDAGDSAACEVVWSGTHSGPFRLPGGGEAAATGKTFERRNLIQAWRGPDGKVIKWHVLSAYPEIVAELSELSAPETNRALSISLTKA
jgi:ketosteroid isomerase-like protein